MTVRKAVLGDVENLVDMGQRFAGETELPMTYDNGRAFASFARAIREDDVILLVWETDGKVLAGLVLGRVADDEFCSQRCCYIMKFYVEQEFRGLSVARDLLEAFDYEAHNMGADVLFASATAGMGPVVEKLYVRLFEKQGYNVLGRVLVKELANE